MKSVLTVLFVFVATIASAQVHPCDVPQVNSFTVQGPVNAVDVVACMFVADTPTGMIVTVDGVDQVGGSFIQTTTSPNVAGLAQYSVSIAAPAVGNHTVSVWSVNAQGRATSAAGPFALIIAGPAPTVPRPASHVAVKAS